MKSKLFVAIMIFPAMAFAKPLFLMDFQGSKLYFDSQKITYAEDLINIELTENLAKSDNSVQDAQSKNLQFSVDCRGGAIRLDSMTWFSEPDEKGSILKTEETKNQKGSKWLKPNPKSLLEATFATACLVGTKVTPDQLRNEKNEAKQISLSQENLTVLPQNRQMNTLRNLKPTKKGSPKSERARIAFYCGKDKLTFLAIAQYSEENGMGQLVDYTYFPLDPKEVPENGLLRDLYKGVCN